MILHKHLATHLPGRLPVSQYLLKPSRNCSRSVTLVFLPALSEGFRIGQGPRLAAAAS